MDLSVSIERHDLLWVKATADVAAGWRKNEQGYGFFPRGGIPYPGDRSIEFTMNVRVRPHNRFSHFTTFPRDLRVGGDLLWRGIDGFGVFAVKDGRAGVVIAVGALREELEREEGNPLHFVPVVLLQGPGSVRVQMSVSVSILSSPPTRVGDIREWHTEFFQGGLPSLGKRRP